MGKEGTQGHCGPHTGELFRHGRSLTRARGGDIYSFPAGKKLGGECEMGRKEKKYYPLKKGALLPCILKA